MASTLADFLTSEEIPEKLQCKICHRLALEAFRLPCCDESTCSSCHTELPDTCPLCSHSPISKDDCKPNKNLRQTVKSFLRSEEKKRQKDRGETVAPKIDPDANTHQDRVGANESLPDPPLSSVDELPLTGGTVDLNDGDVSALVDATADAALSSSVEVSEVQLKDLPLDPNQNSTQSSEDIDKKQDDDESIPMDEDDEDDDDSSSVEIRVSPPPLRKDDVGMVMNDDTTKSTGPDENQTLSQPVNEIDSNLNSGFVSGPSGAGSWPVNGPDNTMNPMMAMQNGMLQNMLGMGMMTPAVMQQMQQMMSQGMFFDGGMGMNGMNGMNMGAMGFNAGFGNWGMPGAMGNMNMNGDFGNNGYFQGPRANRGGYGRGSSGHRFRNEYYPRNRFQGHSNPQRGFGRDTGRRFSHSQFNGYAGRRASTENVQSKNEQNMSSSQMKNDGQDDQISFQSENYETSAVELTVDQHPLPHVSKDVEAGISATSESNPSLEATHTNEGTAPHGIEQAGALNEVNDLSNDRHGSHVLQTRPDTRDSLTSPTSNITTPREDIPLTSSLGPNVPLGPAAQYATPELSSRGRGSSRRSYRGSWSLRGRAMGNTNVSMTSPTEPKGVGVVGAPTGPKALREGMPNVGFRGRGPSSAIRSGHGALTGGRSSAIPTAGTPPHEHYHNTDSRRSRSQSPNDSRYLENRRLSSNAGDEYDSDYDRKQERGQRRSHREESDYYEDDEKNDKKYDEIREDPSDSEHRRPHRREKDKQRSFRYEEDRVEDRKKQKHRNDKYGYYRERDAVLNSRSHENNRRHSRRESYRDRQDENRARDDYRKRSPSPAGFDPNERSRRQSHNADARRHPSEITSLGTKREFKIQGRSRLSELEVQKEKVREEKPDIDPYALEREARQRERLLKEEQRRGSYNLTTGNDRKRSRDEVDGFGTERVNGEADARAGRKKAKQGLSTRRAAYKYDDLGTDEYVTKMAKTERDREAARWD